VGKKGWGRRKRGGKEVIRSGKKEKRSGEEGKKGWGRRKKGWGGRKKGMGKKENRGGKKEGREAAIRRKTEVTLGRRKGYLKGTVSRDFSLLVFFINQFPPSPRVSH
jgi:hypothetical protein